MVQQVKVFAVKFDSLSLIPVTYMIKREMTPVSCPLTSVCTITCAHK